MHLSFQCASSSYVLRPSKRLIVIFSLLHREGKGALERRGFYITNETQVSSEVAAARRKAIEEIATRPSDHSPWEDWYVEKFKTLASDSSWMDQYDKNYVMAYDLRKRVGKEAE